MTNENKLARNFIIGTFVTLYVMVSIISTIHVISFFELSNPKWLAITLALAFEVGAAASLASIIALKKMNKGIVWALFFILTAMQAMGNAYFAYVNLKDYNSWVELFGLVDYEPIFQKRILSIVSGAILPLVALGFIKSLVDYMRPEEVKDVIEENTKPTEEIQSTIEPKDDLQEVAKDVWEKVDELRENGKLPEITKEDIIDEPTALANSQYREDLSDKENILDEDNLFDNEENLLGVNDAEELNVIENTDDVILEEVITDSIEESIMTSLEDVVPEELISQKPIEVIVDNKEVYPVYDEIQNKNKEALDNIMVFTKENDNQ